MSSAGLARHRVPGRYLLPLHQETSRRPARRRRWIEVCLYNVPERELTRYDRPQDQRVDRSQGFAVGTIERVARRALATLADDIARSRGLLCLLNNDQTTRKQRDAIRDARLERRVTLHWNAIPWPVAPTRGIGTSRLPSRHCFFLLDTLHSLRGVIALGAHAGRVWEETAQPVLRSQQCSSRAVTHSRSAPGVPTRGRDRPDGPTRHGKGLVPDRHRGHLMTSWSTTAVQGLGVRASGERVTLVSKCRLWSTPGYEDQDLVVARRNGRPLRLSMCCGTSVH
jgi:hypothetical protein